MGAIIRGKKHAAQYEYKDIIDYQYRRKQQIIHRGTGL
jgi:hypothetical protein